MSSKLNSDLQMFLKQKFGAELNMNTIRGGTMLTIPRCNVTNLTNSSVWSTFTLESNGGIAFAMLVLLSAFRASRARVRRVGLPRMRLLSFNDAVTPLCSWPRVGARNQSRWVVVLVVVWAHGYAWTIGSCVIFLSGAREVATWLVGQGSIVVRALPYVRQSFSKFLLFCTIMSCLLWRFRLVRRAMSNERAARL